MRNRPGTPPPTWPRTGLSIPPLDDDAIAIKHVKKRYSAAIELKIENEKYLKNGKIKSIRNLEQYRKNFPKI